MESYGKVVFMEPPPGLNDDKSISTQKNHYMNRHWHSGVEIRHSLISTSECQFQVHPGQTHKSSVKHILSTLKVEAYDIECSLATDKCCRLVGYYDTDLANDVVTRK
ncbi:hypothetical protein NPIL_408921 [Nephila pilipes]|uniref:Uncharacterized protein n=1 Tax=Nephila pilipes TaxID=299642 RepID=A0A8X6NK13_NEPPI|nr:hypothetical protein NPIL_408921 [Nephila pilipes]